MNLSINPEIWNYFFRDFLKFSIFSALLEIFIENYQILKNRLQIPGFRSEILAMKCGTELKTPLSEMVQITPYFATFHKISKMKEGSASQRSKNGRRHIKILKPARRTARAGKQIINPLIG